MEADPAHVVWTRIRVGESTSGPWEARLVQADRTCFATIGQTLDERWSVTLFPKGWSRDCCHFYIGSDTKAKAWIERWAKHHWRSVVPKLQQRRRLAEAARLNDV